MSFIPFPLRAPSLERLNASNYAVAAAPPNVPASVPPAPALAPFSMNDAMMMNYQSQSGPYYRPPRRLPTNTNSASSQSRHDLPPPPSSPLWTSSASASIIRTSYGTNANIGFAGSSPNMSMSSPTTFLPSPRALPPAIASNVSNASGGSTSNGVHCLRITQLRHKPELFIPALFAELNLPPPASTWVHSGSEDGDVLWLVYLDGLSARLVHTSLSSSASQHMRLGPTIYASPPASDITSLKHVQMIFPQRSNFAAARYPVSYERGAGAGRVPIPLPTPDSSPVKASFGATAMPYSSNSFPAYPPPAALSSGPTPLPLRLPIPLPPLPVRFPSSSSSFDTKSNTTPLPPRVQSFEGSKVLYSRYGSRESLPLTPPASASFAQASFPTSSATGVREKPLIRWDEGNEDVVDMEMDMELEELDSPGVRMRALVEGVLDLDHERDEEVEHEDQGEERKMMFSLEERDESSSPSSSNDSSASPDSNSPSNSSPSNDESSPTTTSAAEEDAGRPRSLTSSTSASNNSSGSAGSSSTSTTDALGSLLSAFPRPPLPGSFASIPSGFPSTPLAPGADDGGEQRKAERNVRGATFEEGMRAPIPISMIERANIELRARESETSPTSAGFSFPSSNGMMTTNVTPRPRVQSQAEAPGAPQGLRIAIPLPSHPSSYSTSGSGSGSGFGGESFEGGFRRPQPPPAAAKPSSNNNSNSSSGSGSYQSLLTPDGKHLASNFGPWVLTSIPLLDNSEPPSPSSLSHLFPPSPSFASSSTTFGPVLTIHWPTGFPLPTPGQVRPYADGVVHPPIMNTGNIGPIQTQVGDWHCASCGYTNWRRRRICQGCYPYAEGNIDMNNAATVDKVNLVARTLLATALAEASAEPLPASARASSPYFGHHQHQPQYEAPRRYRSTNTRMPPPPPISVSTTSFSSAYANVPSSGSVPMTRSNARSAYDGGAGVPFPRLSNASNDFDARPSARYEREDVDVLEAFPSSTAFRSSRANSLGARMTLGGASSSATGYGYGAGRMDVSPPLRSAPAQSGRFDLGGSNEYEQWGNAYSSPSSFAPAQAHAPRRLYSSSSTTSLLSPTASAFFPTSSSRERLSHSRSLNFASAPSMNQQQRSNVNSSSYGHGQYHSGASFPPSPATTSSGSTSFSSSYGSSAAMSTSTRYTSETSPQSVRSTDSVRYNSAPRAGAGKYGAIGGERNLAPIKW